MLEKPPVSSRTSSNLKLAVTVLGGDEPQAFGQGEAELQGDEIDAAAVGDEAVRDRLVEVERPRLGGDVGRLVEDGGWSPAARNGCAGLRRASP